MNKLKFILTLVVITSLNSCKKEEAPTPESPLKDMALVLSSKTNVDAYKLDIYMMEDPFVGFNKIYIEVYDSISGERASDWNFTLKPMMTMMMNGTTMQHTSPVEQPKFSKEMNAYEGAVVFIMPTSDMGVWNMDIAFENNRGSGTLQFSPKVVEKDNPALLSFLSASNPDKKYFVALLNPTKPDVGINDFEIGIYTKESMMSFPTVDGLEVTIAPEMPTMGHGSPDNVNPVSMGNGHYKGSVNFTMSGLWHVNLTIKDGDNMIDEGHYFAIEF